MWSRRPRSSDQRADRSLARSLWLWQARWRPRLAAPCQVGPTQLATPSGRTMCTGADVSGRRTRVVAMI